MPIKIATIIGARPQFVKAAALSSAFKASQSVQEIIIHTGQHYDYEMSKLFFEQLAIPAPDYNLDAGSCGGSQGLQTAKIIQRVEEVLLNEKPSLVLVYGDTNSTMAAALAGVKLHLPIAHVESGMRSFNRSMPEEINRVVTDHVASLHFCSTRTAVNNLRNEGIRDGVHLVGDVMYDVARKSVAIAEARSQILKTHDLWLKRYYLATVHRQSNTDNMDNLKSILEAFSKLDLPVIFPVHPRTKKVIESLNPGAWSLEPGAHGNVHFIEPVGYLDMLVLEKNAKAILTDSGGVQKEAYFYKVPCVTLRDETEWIETIESGWNVLTGPSRQKIIKAVRNIKIPHSSINLYGDGHAAEKIVNILCNFSSKEAISSQLSAVSGEKK